MPLAEGDAGNVAAQKTIAAGVLSGQGILAFGSPTISAVPASNFTHGIWQDHQSIP